MFKQFPDVWQKLHKLQNNLSFSKSTMTAATKAVMEKKQEEWQLTEAQKLEQPKVPGGPFCMIFDHFWGIPNMT
jgi:hypothetical protein